MHLIRLSSVSKTFQRAKTVIKFLGEFLYIAVFFVVFSVIMGLTNGCSLVQDVKPVEVHTVTEQKPKLVYPKYGPLELQEVHFTVLHEEAYTVYYALDSKNYKNLSINMLELQSYMKYLNSIIDSYQKYYESDTATNSQESK